MGADNSKPEYTARRATMDIIASIFGFAFLIFAVVIGFAVFDLIRDLSGWDFIAPVGVGLFWIVGLAGGAGILIYYGFIPLCRAIDRKWGAGSDGDE